MALTNEGKKLAMEEGVLNGTRYISLHLSTGTELSGHGYARKAITLNQWTVAANGQAVGPTALDIYTANDGSAQDADQVALYDASTGGNQIFTPETLTTDVGAPQNGQTFRLTLTLTP